MRLAIVGPGRSGKDEVAAWFARNTRLRYGGSTSEVIAPHAAKALGLSVAEAFARRHEDRDLWHRLGIELRKHDHAALARAVLKRGDLVVGVRDRVEMETVLAERLVDLAVWIDRPGIPDDPTLEYGPELCDVTIQNHWGLTELHGRLKKFANAIGVLKAC